LVQQWIYTAQTWLSRPSEKDHLDISGLQISYLQPSPKGTFTATSVQLTLIESLPVRLRILRLLKDLHFEVSYDRVPSVSSELIEALRTCNRRLKEGDGSTALQRNLLKLLIRWFMIPMHYSFSKQPR
jgi:hypothetical protein